jgi:hypothetical protein
VSKDCTQAAKPKSCYKCGLEGHIVRFGCLHRQSNVCSLLFSRAIAQIAKTQIRSVVELAMLLTATIGRAVRNATNVARLAISQELALNLVDPRLAPLEAAVQTRPGNCHSIKEGLQGTFKLTFFNSYTCGGQGHLSRDCSSGAKCYNCSGVVRFIKFSA